jgi:hypothetical protein
LNGVSHDDVIDLIGRDAASLERPPASVRAELDSTDVRERTPECAEWGASAFHDDDVLLRRSIVHCRSFELRYGRGERAGSSAITT